MLFSSSCANASDIDASGGTSETVPIITMEQFSAADEHSYQRQEGEVKTKKKARPKPEVATDFAQQQVASKVLKQTQTIHSYIEHEDAENEEYLSSSERKLLITAVSAGLPCALVTVILSVPSLKQCLTMRTLEEIHRAARMTSKVHGDVS